MKRGPEMQRIPHPDAERFRRLTQDPHVEVRRMLDIDYTELELRAMTEEASFWRTLTKPTKFGGCP